MPTIKELFQKLPEYANEAAIQGVDKTIQFHMIGEEPGDYYLRVQDGQVTTQEGVAEEPNVTVTAPSEVWKQIVTGQLNGAVAFMSGKFKATGDLSVLMSMQNWFNMPG